ncbi:Cloroperoxidase [Trametes gibbosa]|nr:Cloroperoxidase [Trametes gibbosa]
MALLLVALRRLSLAILSALHNVLLNAAVFTLDFLYTLSNLLTPDRPLGHVVQKGHPGHGGQWPQYIPPSPADSRCSCPALNALANHGILPRDGRNISFKELAHVVRHTYNFAPSFCFFVPNYIASALGRPYASGRFDLADIDTHNCIEHDASLTRVDSALDPHQGKIAAPLVRALLRSGSGPGGNLVRADLSRALGRRRLESKRLNPNYSQSFVHKMFGSSNGSTLLTIFGGRVADLAPLLTEERIPDGWEPRVRHRLGLTLCAFNATVLPVELGIREEVDGSLAAAGAERYGSCPAQGGAAMGEAAMGEADGVDGVDGAGEADGVEK